MKTDKKQLKQQAIEKAAYELIEEKGFLGMSMLAIARRAKASNETLYNWYGDKNGLFKVLIQNNANQTKQLLESALLTQQSALQTLEQLGPILLNLLLGERAIALNRAAAADATGKLGELLSAAGKETIFPLIVRLFERCALERPGNAMQAAQDYLGLLVGDLQIRRAIGAIPKPSPTEIEARAAHAFRSIQTLHPIPKEKVL
jgi:AcrR family transcriptional regulator